MKIVVYEEFIKLLDNLIEKGYTHRGGCDIYNIKLDVSNHFNNNNNGLYINIDDENKQFNIYTKNI